MEQKGSARLYYRGNRKELPMTEKFAAIRGLVAWFQKSKRGFPWRDHKDDPRHRFYAVWVSEVMLQQTRAEVVVPYFRAWMKRFPTIEDLALADETQVIKAWEGLGYYSRARRLLEGALFLIEKKKGILPNSYEELLEIPGFGPYTAGAVASFALRQKAPAVDGNVTRVLCRVFCIEEEVDSPKVQANLRKVTWDILPDKEPWVAMEALIELGATVCRKTPDCLLCPLASICKAHRDHRTSELPRKKKREKIEKLEREVAILLYEDEVLVGKGQPGKVMAGLYEFPYFNVDDKPLLAKLQHWLLEEPAILDRLDTVEHSFTRYQVRIHPFLFRCKEKRTPEGYEWHPIKQLRALPFSSGHRRVLEQILVGWDGKIPFCEVS